MQDTVIIIGDAFCKYLQNIYFGQASINWLLNDFDN